MNPVFSSSLRQSCRGAGFWLGVILIPLLVFVPQADTLAEALRQPEGQAAGFALRFFQEGIKGDSLAFFLPLLCALPAAAGFLDDWKTGYLKFVLPRCRRGSYLWGKILACAVSGGLVLLLGLLLAAGACLIALSPLEQAALDADSLRGLLRQLLPSVLLLSLSGGFWAAFGMLFSTVTGSRYVAYLSPFIGYYLLVILCERYFPALYVLYPREWLFPGEGWPLGALGAALWVGELLLLALALFVGAAGRRLRNG